MKNQLECGRNTCSRMPSLNPELGGEAQQHRLGPCSHYAATACVSRLQNPPSLDNAQSRVFLYTAHETDHLWDTSVPNRHGSTHCCCVTCFLLAPESDDNELTDQAPSPSLTPELER
ncbi:unnamed protein product [Gulo gulo]|uniref:Uncharacterized protein n=1 Tax=Gulo gulo TaxID=48420 RepID=A0A9X9LDJ2_GULGU|nr:unnamed protein product [Gulo gulo]